MHLCDCGTKTTSREGSHTASVVSAVAGISWYACNWWMVSILPDILGQGTRVSEYPSVLYIISISSGKDMLAWPSLYYSREEG